MNVSKEKAFKQLEILGNTRNSIDERTKAIIYLCQYITLSYEPVEFEYQQPKEEEPTVVENPYRLKAEGSI